MFYQTFFIEIPAHPSCIGMSNKMYKRCLEYYWKCAECKTCSKCKLKRDNKMLFCDQCDRGYHIYCLGLRNVPEGKFQLQISFRLPLPVQNTLKD